ncbi:MAG: hypothetical protein U0572_11670 [Phycisphaerales bacterium]
MTVPAVTESQRPPIRIPLSQLKRGDRAIVELETLHEDETRLLEAMGLGDRAAVRICRAGTPCIIETVGQDGHAACATRLGLSADVATKILTTPCDCPLNECRAQRAQ